MREIFVGILAGAAALYEVDVHASVHLSNYGHALLTPKDARELARFCCYVNTNLSKEAGQPIRRRRPALMSSFCARQALSQTCASLRLIEAGRMNAPPTTHRRTLMGHHRKLLFKILSGKSDSTIRFLELCSLLRRLGFEERVHRSAKPYQVRQVRDVLLGYGLGDSADD